MVWLNIIALSSVDALRDLPDAVIRNDSAWQAWYDLEALEQSPMPDYEGHLTKFERMCVVKVSRQLNTHWQAFACPVCYQLGRKVISEHCGSH